MGDAGPQVSLTCAAAILLVMLRNQVHMCACVVLGNKLAKGLRLSIYLYSSCLCPGARASSLRGVARSRRGITRRTGRREVTTTKVTATQTKLNTKNPKIDFHGLAIHTTGQQARKLACVFRGEANLKG